MVRSRVRVAASHRLLLGGLVQDTEERCELGDEDNAYQPEEGDVSLQVVQVPAIRESRLLLVQTDRVGVGGGLAKETADGQTHRGGGGGGGGRRLPAVLLVRRTASLVGHCDGCNRKAHEVLQLEDSACSDLT
eukprot:scaffold40234_cov68-Phaeocystis_antarctica.AAC.8